MPLSIIRLNWADLNSSAPTMLGGSENQVAGLIEALRAIEGQSASDSVDQTELERTHRQVGSLSLTTRTANGLELTALAHDYLREPTTENLFTILNARLTYFSELLARIASEPTDVATLREHAVSEFLMSWSSADQVRRRIAWLISMGLVEEGGNRVYHATEKGLETLKTADVYSAAEATSALARAGVEERPVPAPPALNDALTDSANSDRSLSWSYFTKDPVLALTLLSRVAQSGITKEAAVDHISEEFGISKSSAKSFVDTAGSLGIYRFTGKFEITTTPLGVEWIENASSLNFVRLLHSRYAHIGEALLVLSDQPKTVAEVHNEQYKSADDAPRQDRTAGVMRYLSAAGAAIPIGYAKYVITGLGRSLLLELPLQSIAVSHDSASEEREYASSEIEQLEVMIAELESSSKDSANPRRFELACATAFEALGVRSKHLGGPGRTDVLVTIESSLRLVSRVIVDAKSAAGQLTEGSIKFDALKEHAAKHGANGMAVVAPSFDGAGRLPDWARANEVNLITVSELSHWLRMHNDFPFAAADVAGLLTVGGREDVELRHQQSTGWLRIVTTIVSELLTEREQSSPEPLAPRDIGRLMRRTSFAISDDDVASVLDLLAQPEIGAVSADKKPAFTLPSSPSVAAGRLRAIASAIEAATASNPID